MRHAPVDTSNRERDRELMKSRVRHIEIDVVTSLSGMVTTKHRSARSFDFGEVGPMYAVDLIGHDDQPELLFSGKDYAEMLSRAAEFEEYYDLPIVDLTVGGNA